jgi:oxygen-independent coproporphyrinogen-3 oxidase
MHLYLHVPFCARRCGYCDFAIAVRREVPSAEFAEAVLREWRRWMGDPLWAGAGQLATFYLGGGTPSRLAPDAVARILGEITAERPLAPGAEVTLEANPEDVTREAATAWRAAGVNRVSLGVQSFDPGVLAWMHRTHTAQDVPRAVAALRDAGIANLSLDLIFALPESLGRDWARDLDQALALEPDHLSLYGLTVERGTPLGRWVDRGEVRPVGEGRYAEEFLTAHVRLTAAGYRHYEVSNYGRPGREAVHNGAYWRRAPYLGLGPSAHSASGTRRWWNQREWAAWQRAILAGESAVAEEETLTPDAVGLEELYLTLRTDQGIEAERIPGRLLDPWLETGWARLEGGAPRRVVLTAEGWLRLDALVSAAGA